jgi:hypothetical protein
MFETLYPASLANPEKAELPPSTQREMGWRGDSESGIHSLDVAIMLLRFLANQGRAALSRRRDIGAAPQRGPTGMGFCQPTG